MSVLAAFFGVAWILPFWFADLPQFFSGRVALFVRMMAQAFAVHLRGQVNALHCFDWKLCFCIAVHLRWLFWHVNARVFFGAMKVFELDKEKKVLCSVLN